MIVVAGAEHLCMTMRGVQKPGSRTITSAVRGVLKDEPEARAEALALLQRRNECPDALVGVQRAAAVSLPLGEVIDTVNQVPAARLRDVLAAPASPTAHWVHHDRPDMVRNRKRAVELAHRRV